MMTRHSYVAATVDVPRALRLQRRAIFIAFILIIAFPIGLDWYRNRELPVVSSVSIQNVKLVSPEHLCPGEKLIFTYDLNFEGSGVLVRDLTVWNVDPPKTIIFSMARRFILPDTINQKQLLEAWTVPATYHSFETDETEVLPPGNYQRQIAISSAVKEDVVTVAWVNFSIRNNCSQ